MTNDDARRQGTPLADEHAELLWQITVRADAVLDATRVGWPADELAALLGYLHYELIDQVSAEDWQLLPLADRAADRPRITRLGRDHTRLRAAIEVLAQAAAAPAGSRNPEQVTTLTRDLVNQLSRHLQAEEAVLAAADETGEITTAAAATASHRSHAWYPFTEGPLVDMDLLPADEAEQAVIDRLGRLQSGEALELCTSTNPQPLWRRLGRTGHRDYGWTVLEDGPPRWRIHITRRIPE